MSVSTYRFLSTRCPVPVLLPKCLLAMPPDHTHKLVPCSSLMLSTMSAVTLELMNHTATLVYILTATYSCQSLTQQTVPHYTACLGSDQRLGMRWGLDHQENLGESLHKTFEMARSCTHTVWDMAMSLNMLQ